MLGSRFELQYLLVYTWWYYTIRLISWQLNTQRRSLSLVAQIKQSLRNTYVPIFSLSFKKCFKHKYIVNHKGAGEMVQRALHTEDLGSIPNKAWPPPLQALTKDLMSWELFLRTTWLYVAPNQKKLINTRNRFEVPWADPHLVTGFPQSPFRNNHKSEFIANALAWLFYTYILFFWVAFGIILQVLHSTQATSHKGTIFCSKWLISLTPPPN